MNRLAIIPARGGSKRIPKKNVKHFCGLPIIAHAIKTAIDSGLFSEVMVSTDSEDIASVAKQYGAKVPFMRSAKNADDHATTFDVIEEVISFYKDKGIEFEEACCIYATAAFVRLEKLNEAFDLLRENEFDCVYPAMRYGFPVQRSVRVDATTRKMEMLQPEYVNTRSQDLEPIFHDAGQFYCFNTKSLMDKKKLWTNNTGVIEISELEAHDIDNEVDWKLAEIKFNLLDKL